MDYTLSHCPCTLSLLQVLIAELEKAEALAKRLHRETLEASSAVAAQIEAETRALADTTNTAIKQRGHTAPGLCLKQLTALDSLRRLLKPRTKYLVSECVCVCVCKRERERESYCAAHGCTHAHSAAGRPAGYQRFSANDPLNSAFLDGGVLHRTHAVCCSARTLSAR
jgi:hypothetical protein